MRLIQNSQFNCYILAVNNRKTKFEKRCNFHWHKKSNNSKQNQIPKNKSNRKCARLYLESSKMLLTEVKKNLNNREVLFVDY